MSSEVEHEFSLPKLCGAGLYLPTWSVFRPSPGAPHLRVDLSVCPKGRGDADGPTQKGDPFLKGAMCGWQAASVILIRWYLPMFRRSEGHFEPCDNMNMGSLWSLRTICHLPHVWEEWNLARASLAPVKLAIGSHVFSSCPYPSHFTR